MELSNIQYIEVNSIGIIILLIMSIHTINYMRYASNYNSHKGFLRMSICNIVVLFTDSVMQLSQLSSSNFNIFISYLSGIIYFTCHSLFGFWWLKYIYTALYPNRKMKNFEYLLCLIPLILNTIVSVSSPLTHWMFYQDASNTYFRGTLIYSSVIFTFIYWLVGLVLVIKEMVTQRVIRERAIYITILLFPIPTLIGNIIQMSFFGITLVWVCTAISLLILFISIEDYQTYRDSLTGLFNRHQANIYIRKELLRTKDKDSLFFVIMIDLDHFKSINDNYGHVTGDYALIEASEIIKQSCRERDFVARIGGDEFIVCGRAKNISEITKIITCLDTVSQKRNLDKLREYNLSFSCGYTTCDNNSPSTLDDMLRQADHNMYILKRSKNNNIIPG